MPRINIENRVGAKCIPSLAYHIETSHVYWFVSYNNIQVMETISTNRNVSVQKQLKHHYFSELSFCFVRTSTSDTSL